jgi:hypothetical protein
VHSNGANVVWVCLERCDLLRGVVVVYAQLEVIGTYIRATSMGAQLGAWVGIPPATIQFFLATKRPARTGTSVSSNVLTIDCVMYDQMWTCPAAVSLRQYCCVPALHTAVQGREDPWLSRVKVFRYVSCSRRLQKGGSYRFLEIVSGALQVCTWSRLPLTLSDPAKSCLYSPSLISKRPAHARYSIAHWAVPLRLDACCWLEVCIAEG